MSTFELPLTVRAGPERVDLILRVPPAARFADARSVITDATGLPGPTPLFLGGQEVPDDWLLGQPPLLAGCPLTTEPGRDGLPGGSQPPEVKAPLRLACVAGPDAGAWVGLSPGQSVHIGRGEECGLRLDDPALSRRHATLAVTGAGIVLIDRGSTNGLRVEGDRGDIVPDAQERQWVRLGGSVVAIALADEPPLRLAPDGRGRMVVTRPARLRPAFRIELPPEPGPVPQRTRRPLPLISAVLGAVAGAAIAALTGMWMFLLLAALGPVLMLGTALGDRVAGRRSHRSRLQHHRVATAADARALDRAVHRDRADARDRYPDPATLLNRAETTGYRLWERRPEDPDFLHLVVGVGSRPARIDRPAPPVVAEVPIPIDLRRARVLGLTGRARPVLVHLLAQLLVLHAPADLRVVVCSARPDLLGLRGVPHCGLLVTDPREAVHLGALRSTAITVLVLDGGAPWRTAPAVREFLAQADAGSQWLAICLDEDPHGLPVECRQVVTVDDGLLHLADRDTAPAPEPAGAVEPTGVGRAYLDRLLVALTRLRDPDDIAAGLPEAVGLADAGQLVASTDPIRRAWRAPQLTALLGVGPGGPLSWAAEQDGPHLLVAGTTGAGKSELLQTLIVSLSCVAPPQRCSFLLVDYKGGAAFAALAGLPHVTGVITDLDGELSGRALRSLRAELRRRERVLTAAGAVDLAGYRALDGPAAPASLFIVVDEFATLAAELPEFLTGLLDVAQRGRSLGVHLVLATQRPAGVLSPAIRANLATRICLRVTDPAESADVVGVPDAAAIPASLPGRAVLRTGDILIPFQTARVRPGGAAGVTARRVGSGGCPAGVPGLTGPGSATAALRRPEAARSGVTDWVQAVSRAARGVPRPAPTWCPALPDLIRPDPASPCGWATVDRPDLGRQDILDAPGRSVLITGPPGSGRTSALGRLARIHAAGGGALILLDAAAQLLPLARWPGTLARWSGPDPDLLGRQVGRLHDELARRAATQGLGIPGGSDDDRGAAGSPAPRDSPELAGATMASAFPSSPGSTAPPVLVLIDGLESVTAVLDQLDYGAGTSRLAEVIGRGPALGVRVAATGDPRAVNHRLAVQFGTVLALATDARGEPGPATPGRGRIDGDEVQLWWDPPVSPLPGGAVDAGPTELGRLNALVVAPLPDIVGSSRMPVPRAGAVPVGLGGDRAEVVFLDLTGPGGGLLVAGPRRSGVSTTLRRCALGAAAAGLIVLRLTRRPVDRWPGVAELDTADGGTNLQHRLQAHQGPLLLVADSWTDDDPTTTVLQRFLNVAGPGQYLLLGTRLDLATRSYRGLTAETAAFRSGILLHAGSGDGHLLDTVLPRRTGVAPPGRGHLIVAGAAVPLQVAHSQP